MSEFDAIREVCHQHESELRKRRDECVKRGSSKDRHELFKWLCKNILSSQANWDDAKKAVEALDKDGRLWTLGAQEMAGALWELGYAKTEEKRSGAEGSGGKHDRERKARWLAKARERFFGNNNPEDILVWTEKLRDNCARGPVEARDRLADLKRPGHIDGMGMKVSSHFLRGLGFSRDELAILDCWVLNWLVQNNVISKTEGDRKVVARDKEVYRQVESKMKCWVQANGNDPPLDDLDWLIWNQSRGSCPREKSTGQWD